MTKNCKYINYIDRRADSINLLLKDVRKSDPLATEEEYDLWQQMRQGNMKAREQLIFANMRFAVSVAKEYLWMKAPFEDLAQAAFLGLVLAADKFDATIGCRFITYATWFVKNEVQKMANNYKRHDCLSLDEAEPDAKDSDTARVDRLMGDVHQSADWNLRYRDTLEELKRRLEYRQYGLGPLLDDFYQMLQKGYNTADFARKHRLNEQQMTRFLDTLGEEAGLSLKRKHMALAA